MPVLAGYAHLLAAGRRAQWDEAGLRLVPAPGGGPDAVRRLVAGFCVAEQAVAEHLLPIAAAAADPQLREALELQAADEARHARFFARVADEALALEDPHALAGPELVALFRAHLPATAARVAAGEAGLGDGVGLYHLVLEGVVLQAGTSALLAELGAVREAWATPVLAGVRRVQADERWHVGLGVTALRELGAAPPDLRDVAQLALRAWDHPLADPEHHRELLRRRLSLAAVQLAPGERGAAG